MKADKRVGGSRLKAKHVGLLPKLEIKPKVNEMTKKMTRNSLLLSFNQCRLDFLLQK